MLSKYQYYGQGFQNGTHMLGIVCTNLGREALMVKIEKRPHDLCLTILHAFLLKAHVKAGVVLGFFDRLFLDCFRLDFMVGKWAGLLEEA